METESSIDKARLAATLAFNSGKIAGVAMAIKESTNVDGESTSLYLTEIAKELDKIVHILNGGPYDEQA